MNSHFPLVIAHTSYCSHDSATCRHASLININGLSAACTGGRGFGVLLRFLGWVFGLIGIIRGGCFSLCSCCCSYRIRLDPFFIRGWLLVSYTPSPLLPGGSMGFFTSD